MERPPARTFQDLLVWEKAHEFVLEIYKITKSFPREEIYGLTSQFRRGCFRIDFLTSVFSLQFSIFRGGYDRRSNSIGR